MNAKEKKLLENKIYNIIKESIDDDGRRNDRATATRERNIIKWLTDDQEKCSAVAALLWPEKDEETRRSLFSKKMRGHDADGKSYSFSEDEVNKLFNIKNTYVKKIDENRLATMIRESIVRHLNEGFETTGGDIDGLRQALQNAGYEIIDRRDGDGFRIISPKDLGLTGEPEWVASYMPKAGYVKPTHGYFMPHPTGRKIAKICSQFGVEFNNM